MSVTSERYRGLTVIDVRHERPSEMPRPIVVQHPGPDADELLWLAPGEAERLAIALLGAARNARRAARA